VAGDRHLRVRAGGHDEQRIIAYGSGGWRGVALQFVLVVIAALFYFGVRGLTQGSVQDAVDNGFAVLEFERRLGLDIEAAVQDAVLSNHTLVTLANWVYMWGHWPVVATTLVVLYRRDRRTYLLLRNAMFVSGGIGLVIFASYPVAPPRLLPDDTYVDTVTNWSNSYRVLQPPALVNRYAAVPSLHVGWNLLVGVALWLAFRSVVVRAFAVIGPTLMVLAVVATANHYVIDAVLGAVISLASIAAVVWWIRVNDRRRVRLGRDRAPGDSRDQREVIDDHALHPERRELVDVGLRVDAPDEQPRAT
jgi:hypothetical protein